MQTSNTTDSNMYTKEEAEEIVRQKAGEFFPSNDYLFLGERKDGHIKPEEIFRRNEKDGNYHLHWPQPPQETQEQFDERTAVLKNLGFLLKNLETLYLKGNKLTSKQASKLIREKKAIYADGIVIIGKGTGIGVFNRRKKDKLYHLTYTPFRQEANSNRR